MTQDGASPSAAAKESFKPKTDEAAPKSPTTAGDAEKSAPPPAPPFDAAEMGVIAHLYRGEVYRSTIWRTRLDNTTNWSIVTMGIALSSTFSSPEASPLPLILVGMLFGVFLVLEARRYRYFNVWRARARWIETNFYAPILLGRQGRPDWRTVLAGDYTHPRHHISFSRALQRRLRRNYIWIFGIQTVAYWGKIAIHPHPAQSFADFAARAAVGPAPGWLVLALGALYTAGWIGYAIGGYMLDAVKHGPRGAPSSMG